ncbi:MAG: hypothetical protein ACOYM3_14375 [Terrimicrobiaceae bacterium]
MGWLTDILKEVPLSAVLRERLAQAEKDMNELKEENTRLHEELAKLKPLAAKPQTPATLSEIEEQILAFIGNRNIWTGPEHIAALFKLSSTKADYYVEKLHRENYLKPPIMIVDSRPEYQLSQKGREYLVTRNLIE